MPVRKHPDFVYAFADEHIAWLRDVHVVGQKAADDAHIGSYGPLHGQVLEYLRDDEACDRLGLRRRYTVRGVRMGYRSAVWAKQINGSGDLDAMVGGEYVECFLTPAGRRKVEGN